MTAGLRAACLGIFRGIRILSDDTVRFGERVHRYPVNEVVSVVQQAIYRDFYCSMTTNRKPMPREAFVSALSAANAGSGVGPKETIASHGAYIALGAVPPAGTHWLRIYCNVAPEGAIALMGVATRMLNEGRVPFQLKVLADTSVTRLDAAVLYVPIVLWSRLRATIATMAGQIEPLAPTIPLFTKPLVPGIGLAEDPRSGWSFGMHRSGLVARALAQSYLRRHTGEDDQWADLRAEFAEEGLSVEQPYLNPGSSDVYWL